MANQVVKQCYAYARWEIMKSRTAKRGEIYYLDILTEDTK